MVGKASGTKPEKAASLHQTNQTLTPRAQPLTTHTHTHTRTPTPANTRTHTRTRTRTLPKQVSMRSPMPDKPLTVSGRAPSATDTSIISLQPRVTSNAAVLSPRPAAHRRGKRHFGTPRNQQRKEKGGRKKKGGGKQPPGDTEQTTPPGGVITATMRTHRGGIRHPSNARPRLPPPSPQCNVEKKRMEKSKEGKKGFKSDVVAHPFPRKPRQQWRRRS